MAARRRGRGGGWRAVVVPRVPQCWARGAGGVGDGPPAGRRPLLARRRDPALPLYLTPYDGTPPDITRRHSLIQNFTRILVFY